MSQENARGISVTVLTRSIKESLENGSFSNILVEGEISNYKRNTSNHLYFTLKDENAQISCVMFSYSSRTLTFEPKSGDKVLCHGSVSVYEKSGNYQLYVTSIQKKGMGDLFEKYLELKNKLEQKGYFSIERKRKLPEFPKNIALLTSRTGAVIEDMKTIILRRSRFSDLTLYPTAVQGADAKYEIVRNIEKANNNPDIDVIIIARGGGSIEDLWPFNEEIVADAIYNSKKPIISAVGHDTDFTISDFCADLRAATPSDAALLVVKDSRDLFQDLVSKYKRLDQAYRKKIEYERQRISYIDKKPIFVEPVNIIFRHNQLFSNLSGRLENLSPINILETEKHRLSKEESKLDMIFKSILKDKISRHRLLNEKMIVLNPLSILDKGYSVTYKDESIVKSIDMVEKNDLIRTRIQNGEIISKVEEVIEYGKRN